MNSLEYIVLLLKYIDVYNLAEIYKKNCLKKYGFTCLIRNFLEISWRAEQISSTRVRKKRRKFRLMKT